MTTEPLDVNRRILIVDDMVEIHRVFRKLLCPRSPADELARLESAVFGAGAAGPPPVAFEVDVAAQGEEGLAQVRRALGDGRPYAMAFVDMRMPPGWDGLRTITEIWKVDPDVEVVICTAFSDHSDADIVAKLGPTDQVLFLRKPFDPVEVRQLARALTEKWMLRQHARLQLAELERRVATRVRELSAASAQIVEVARRREALDVELGQVRRLETVGRLAGGVAGELDTAVSELATAIEQIPRGDERDPGAVAITAATAATEKIAGLVRGLIELAAVAPEPRTTIDLNRALAGIAAVMNDGIQSCAQLETRYGELPPAPCSPADINLVLFGMVDSAVQAVTAAKRATGCDGRISISTRFEAGHDVIAISDSGERVSEELRARMFEPFFIAPAGGRGGMAAAWRIIVAEHGGTLSLDCPPDGGATVVIRLPVAAA